LLDILDYPSQPGLGKRIEQINYQRLQRK
jgi:hypothetical protein